MISIGEFLEIFNGSGFKEEDLTEFYRSVKKSIILLSLGKRSWPDLLKLEEKHQWPLLQKIDDPALPIYHDADEVLLEHFIKNIREEKRIRKQKWGIKKVSYWHALQSIIEERGDLLKDIFDFCGKDYSYCEAIAERYARIIEKRTRSKRNLWQIRFGAGATTLAGAAALWYASKKDKK